MFGTSLVEERESGTRSGSLFSARTNLGPFRAAKNASHAYAYVYRHWILYRTSPWSVCNTFNSIEDGAVLFLCVHLVLWCQAALGGTSFRKSFRLPHTKAGRGPFEIRAGKGGGKVFFLPLFSSHETETRLLRSLTSWQFRKKCLSPVSCRLSYFGTERVL